jgi:ribosomal protein L9
MSDTNIKAIRKENEALKAKLEAVVREMSSLKEKLDKQCQPLQSRSTQQAKSLPYLSDESMI